MFISPPLLKNIYLNTNLNPFAIQVAEELFVKKSRGRLEAIVDEALQHAKARIK